MAHAGRRRALNANAGGPLYLHTWAEVMGMSEAALLLDVPQAGRHRTEHDGRLKQNRDRGISMSSRDDEDNDRRSASQSRRR